jgi:hypothetical protein
METLNTAANEINVAGSPEPLFTMCCQQFSEATVPWLKAQTVHLCTDLSTGYQ